MTTYSLSLSLHTYHLLLLSCVTAGVAVLLPMTTLAQTQTLRTQVSDMTASVTFDRATPCARYEVSWGDGSQTVATDNTTDVCIQMIDTVTTSHTYETAGTYDIVVETSMGDAAETVTVPNAVTTFDLADVISITYVWVDPNEMMADEEYYKYTISLHDGRQVELEVAGFTTPTYRNEQFVKVGYTGSVDDLLAQATQANEATIGSETVSGETVALEAELYSLYRQLKGLLEQVVQRLQDQLGR